jgi:hypothetical protein
MWTACGQRVVFVWGVCVADDLCLQCNCDFCVSSWLFEWLKMQMSFWNN